MLQPDIPTDGPIRLVIAEGENSERILLCDQFPAHDDFVVRGAESWDALKALLDEGGYDVVVVGGDVGGVSGTEINEKIKTSYRDPPGTILLGTTDNVRAAIRAFRCGFADYLTRDSTGDRDLRSAVARTAQIVRNERQRRQYVEHLEDLARKDSITGVANRHHLQERLEQLARIGKHRAIEFAAILVRINDLDDVCAAFGCKVGDRALHAFANKLKNASRSSDTFGRYDANTFLFLLDRDVGAPAIEATCRRLVEATAFVVNFDDLGLSLSASVGAAVFPADGSTVSELLRAAENALNSGATLRSGGQPSDIAATHGMAVPTEGLPAARESAAGDAQEAARTGCDAGAGNGQGPAGGDQPELPGMPAPASDLNGSATGNDPAAQLVARASDRRIEKRRRALKGGLLVLNDGLSAINCVIRDLSSTGARITVDGHFAAPKLAELVMVEAKTKIPVETRWQKGNEFGLKFRERTSHH